MNEQYQAHWNPYIFNVQPGYFSWYNCTPGYCYNQGDSGVWYPTPLCPYPPPDKGTAVTGKDYDLCTSISVVEKVGHEPDVVLSENCNAFQYAPSDKGTAVTGKGYDLHTSVPALEKVYREPDVVLSKKSNALHALKQDAGSRSPEAKDNFTVVPMDISPKRSPSVKRSLVMTGDSSEEKMCKKPKLVCIPLEPPEVSDLSGKLTELRHVIAMHGCRRDLADRLDYPKDPRKPPLIGKRLPRVLKTVSYDTECRVSKSLVLTKLKQECSSVLSDCASSSSVRSSVERYSQSTSLPHSARSNPAGDATPSHHCIESALECSNLTDNATAKSCGGTTGVSSDCLHGAYTPHSTKVNFTGIFDIQRDLHGFALQGPVSLFSRLENVNDALIACFDELTS
ncbi:uncharacterized protein LOC135399532 isoform X2 [Ornithodoros turicata]